MSIDTSKSKTKWAKEVGVSEAAIRRHLSHGIQREKPGPPMETSESSDGSKSAISAIRDRPITLDDAREWVRSSGDDPDNYSISVRSTAYGEGLFSNKQSAVPKPGPLVTDGPMWRPVSPAPDVHVEVTIPSFNVNVNTWKTAIAVADHQIGFRNEEAFHDRRAIDVAHKIIGYENPDQVIYCGDFLDLAQQGKYEQEPGFAGTTQRSIDYGHELLAIDRELAPKAEIVLVEGNHDARMQKFIVSNAMSAYGLKRANAPESWPVMSIPYLLRLDDINVRYIDSYPAGAWWINDKLRAIHGDKVRSNGSTASAYSNALPHISTVFGHTHRAEIQSKTTFDRAGKIRSMSINPGCMCRVDGEVPSVHGAMGINGKAATTWEDWQQGAAVIRYKDSGEFFVELVQIDNGVTVYHGQEILSA